MNVLHLNFHESRGGAARAMLRLDRGLKESGIDSRLLVREPAPAGSKAESFQRVVPESERLADQLLSAVIQPYGIEAARTPVSNTSFTFPFPGYDLSRHPAVRWADVINLHWASYILSPVTLRTLLDTGKPVVWTVHDQWAFTGGCHYSAGCDGYTRGCDACPQLRGDMALLPGAALSEKLRQLRGRRLHVVGPSRWIAECARRSTVFRDQPVAHIPNGIEQDVFGPGDKAAARAALGLPRDGFFLLFGADHIGELRKGWRHLNEALHHAFRRLGPDFPLRLIFFGNQPADLGDLPVPRQALGYVHDDEKLRRIYNAADLFLLASVEDNQPNTLMESMACGTPVAGFSVGAMPELIRNDENGFLVPPGDASGLGEAVARFAGDESSRQSVPAAARRTIEEHYTLRHQAASYAELYEKALRGARRAAAAEGAATATAFLRGDVGHMMQDRRFVRPLALLLKQQCPASPPFQPGWSFGSFKERRRLDHYLRAWIASRPRWQRAMLTGDHGIYSPATISLREGFSEPNGPLPELHLPCLLIWGRLPGSQLILLGPVGARAELRLEIQSPTPGLRLLIRCGGQVSWEAEVPANFANPSGGRTEILAPLPESSGPETVIHLDYRMPPGATQRDNLGVAFFRIEQRTAPEK